MACRQDLNLEMGELAAQKTMKIFPLTANPMRPM